MTLIVVAAAERPSAWVNQQRDIAVPLVQSVHAQPWSLLDRHGANVRGACLAQSSRPSAPPLTIALTDSDVAELTIALATRR